jgi:hypothetical protein
MIIIMIVIVMVTTIRHFGMYHLPDFERLVKSSSWTTRRWSTFSGVATSTAAHWLQPSTIPHLVNIVKNAHDNRMTVKVVGAGM